MLPSTAVSATYGSGDTPRRRASRHIHTATRVSAMVRFHQRRGGRRVCRDEFQESQEAVAPDDVGVQVGEGQQYESDCDASASAHGHLLWRSVSPRGVPAERPRATVRHAGPCGGGATRRRRSAPPCVATTGAAEPESAGMAGAGLATGSSMHRLAWWGAAIGIGVAIADTLTLGWLGASFEMAGRDVSWLVMTWFGGSFAVVGFLLGDAIETRRRERAAAAALDAARARVAQSEKLAALGQLAAAIAHEVRNPLAVVRSAAQGLGETLPADDTDGHRAASFIVAEVDRLASVVRALLDFARPVELERRPTEIADVIDRAVALAGRDLAAKHVRLERDEAAPLPPVQADGDLVCQVVVGLLGNAAAATPAGGRVVVSTRASNGTVELAVADSGPGIAPQDRAKVFEPFFTTRAEGTGLGLAVARQIVEAHGGRIDVGDGAGGGARFTVRLPVGAA